VSAPAPGSPPIDVAVPEALAGERVDRVVAMLSGLARRTVSELVEGGRVRLDGQVVRTRSRSVAAGERLHVDLPAPVEARLVADPSVQFAVVYEDPQLVVVDKPAGLVVHHGAGHSGGTLVDGLLARFPDLADLAAAGVGDPQRPGIVHRLDKGTSGLLVVARTPAAFGMLGAQFRAHLAEREYLALVAGEMEADAGEVDAPIGRSARQPTRMAVTGRGRPARTAYRVLERFRTPLPTTMVRASLETGRTHQVRVHFAAIGHPVIGDDRYGGPAARPGELLALLRPGRLWLHAWRLTLEHPAGGRRHWEAPLPADLVAVLEALGPPAPG